LVIEGCASPRVANLSEPCIILVAATETPTRLHLGRARRPLHRDKPLKPRVFDPTTSLDHVRLEAQKLAFAPLVFQSSRALRDLGALDIARDAGTHGITAQLFATHATVSLYAANVLLEAGLAAGLLGYEERAEGRTFIITKLGAYWNRDPMTRVNAEFSHHVCYRGAFRLEDALRGGIPAGLPTLGAHATVYEGLAALDSDIREAWLGFDHFYSDGIFDACLAEIPEGVGHLVDIGANTGKFSRLFAERRTNARVTLVDLPGQIALAKANVETSPARERLSFHPDDMLSSDRPLPTADAYWMSQFLDCFSEDQIVAILRRVRDVMTPDARVYIVETFWDRQKYEAARYCVIATSLYFACIANGDSRMYHSEDFRALVERAGLSIERECHDKGMSHSFLCCRRVPLPC